MHQLPATLSSNANFAGIFTNKQSIIFLMLPAKNAAGHEICIKNEINKQYSVTTHGLSCRQSEGHSINDLIH